MSRATGVSMDRRSRAVTMGRPCRAWENVAVGLRESINQRPRLVTAVTVAVIVLSLIAIVLQQRALSPRGARERLPSSYDAPDAADRPVGDEEAPPGGRRPAAAPGARVIASPATTLGSARSTGRTDGHTEIPKTETLA